jgi:peptidyl-tRNA hydrolase
MRQLIIARKDLQMSPGKLAAQCCHASLAFLTDPIGMGQGVEPIEKDGEITGYRAEIMLEKATYEEWFDGSFTKTICGAKSRNQLLKAKTIADERIPILFDLPFKHKGIMCAPFIGPVSIRQYLTAGQIEQVICGGENYDGARPCNFDWVKSLRQECVDANVTFCFIETGTVFIKDGRRYHLPNKQLQSRMACKSGMNFQGRPIHFDLVDDWGYPISQEDLYVPHFRANCETCGSKLICNGCSDCGKCL